MKVFGLAGWSGAGKTTLLIRLITHWSARGLRVSTVKHAHHEFDIDHPGKDSHRHRSAGATEVLVGSARRWALIHELRSEPEPPLYDLLSLMAPVDLVVIEGFKRDLHPKMEVHQAGNGKPWLHPNDPTMRAVAADIQPPGDIRWFDLNAVEAIAAFIEGAAVDLGALQSALAARQ